MIVKGGFVHVAFALIKRITIGVYLISFFPKAWKYTPTTLMESASLLIGTKSIEDYGIAVLITILLVVICLIVSITVMNRKQL